MPTSSQTEFELTRDQYIQAAMRKIGALARGQTPVTEDYTNGQIAANSLIAAYQGLGMVAWKRADYALTLTGTGTYTFGAGETTNTPFPLNIRYAYLQHTTSGTKIELQSLSLPEFNKLNATSTGRVVNYTYTPKTNLGVLQVWPIPDSDTQTNYQLHLVYQKPFDGFTATGETADFPQEWQFPLIYGLAVAIAPEYGLPLDDRKQLMAEWKTWLDMALSVTDTDDSFHIQPDRGW
jgi:hypothetical protein